MAAVERAAGLPARYSAGYMRNPPWALPLVYPLGLMSLGYLAAFGALWLERTRAEIWRRRAHVAAVQAAGR